MFTLVCRILGDYDDAAEVTQAPLWRHGGPWGHSGRFPVFHVANQDSRQPFAQPGFSKPGHALPGKLFPWTSPFLVAKITAVSNHPPRPVGSGDAGKGGDPGAGAGMHQRSGARIPGGACAADVQEYSYAEIGAILGLGAGTVKSRISRARDGIGMPKRVLGRYMMDHADTEMLSAYLDGEVTPGERSLSAKST